MRFERMIRLTMLAGVALALPGAALAASAAAALPGQSAPQSADDYQWIDQADALWDAIGDAPPDTAFPFEGQEPWAWQTQDGYTIIVEDPGDQGIRSYYFAPGESDPFLAVEPGMSFAYDRGDLAMVYDADGEAAPRSEFGDYDDAAHDLFDRGGRLFEALSGRDYRPVDAEAWVEASPYIFSFIQLWDEGRSRYPGWSRYHARSDAAAWRRRFEAEQRRRREQALRFSQWRQGGFQGPPPGRFHPPGRPDGPGAGRPHQPGSGWSHGPGRPGRPGGPGSPGTNPPRPGSGWSHGPGGPGRPGGPGGNPPPRPGTPPVATPGAPGAPPFTRPRPNRPEGSPDWRSGRPRPPVAAPDPGRPAVIEAPTVDAPATVPAPAPQPGTRPPRPEGGWGGRPAGGWRPRPAPVPPVTGTAPTPPSSVTAPPAPAPRPRPEGSWRPRPAPSGDAPSVPQFRPRPAPQPGAAAPVPRPSFTPPAARPQSAPPPSRPSYTPRPSAPAPRPSPPPPPAKQYEAPKAD